MRIESQQFSDWFREQSKGTQLALLFLLSGIASAVLATLVLNLTGTFLATWQNIAILGLPSLWFGIPALIAATRVGPRKSYIGVSLLSLGFLVFAAIQ